MIRRLTSALLTRPWAAPFLALVAVYGVLSALAPTAFLGGLGVETMARQTVVVALGAVGMTLVIVSGGIDLSVGSTVALSSVVVARSLQAGVGTVGAAVAGATVGLACGAVNGSLIAALRITPFIVTLGTMSALRGLAKGLAGEQKIDADPRGLDRVMLPPDAPVLFPPGVWIAGSFALLAALVLGRARFGRHLTAVGSSPAAARLAGISPSRVGLLAYAAAGLLAGVGGVMDFATLTVGDPTGSLGLELSVIAAVVIGGGSLSGGQGSIAGSMVGALLMTVISFGATQLGIANWIQEILTGVIIILAVAVDRARPSL